MSGLILCGKMAKKPLYISQIEKNIYSIEELQFYIYNNIHMIGKEFVDNNLIGFLEVQLNMRQLAQKLDNLQKKSGDFADMIMTILSAGSYYNNEELRGFEKTLKEIGNMTFSQRMKKRADMLYQNGKYESALKLYADILVEIRKSGEQDQFALSVWNNMAAVYGKLFLFKEAYQCLKAACDIRMISETLDRMVMSAILSEDMEIIEDLKKQYGISDGELGEYKDMLEYQKKHIRSSKEYIKLSNTFSFANHNDMSIYYGEVERIVDEWKHTYREEIC